MKKYLISGVVAVLIAITLCFFLSFIDSGLFSIGGYIFPSYYFLSFDVDKKIFLLLLIVNILFYFILGMICFFIYTKIKNRKGKLDNGK